MSDGYEAWAKAKRAEADRLRGRIYACGLAIEDAETHGAKAAAVFLEDQRRRLQRSLEVALDMGD